ncbi:hypothetical protein ACWFNE_03610 [Cellulomonas sp. NPDC055163]
MTVPILVAFAVDDVPAAHEIAAAAQAAGVTALRLLDGGLDPSVVAGSLAGRHGELGYVVDIPTSRNAPYNTARRVLSLDRATAGRTGVALRTGVGDEVSDGAVGAVTDASPAERWTEYAQVLTRLWESFPRDALVGDQERAIVLDASRVHRIDHVGPSYRVAGPLDGPSSVQGRPVLVAADVEVTGWAAVAASADVVVAGSTQGADEALTAVLAAVGRRRDEVALVGRVTVDAVDGVPARLAGEVRARVAADRLDGVELVPLGGSPGALAAVRRLVPLLAGPGAPTTLRAGLRLPELAGVPR